MTDKEDNKGKVQPIRKGLKITQEVEVVKKPINAGLLAAARNILEKVENGEITELVFIGITDDPLIYAGIFGVVYDPHIMHSQLIHMTTKYYDGVLYPIVEGSTRLSEEEFWDDGE